MCTYSPYYTQTDIRTKDEFDTRYTLVNVNISSKTIYDKEEDYYVVCDHNFEFEGD